MRTTHLALFVALAPVFLALGCAHDLHTREKRPPRELDESLYSKRATPAKGSLFAAQGSGLIEDPKPSAPGDIIVVRIDESDSASHDGATKLNRKSDQSYGFSGALEKLVPDANLAKLFGATADSAFEGSGSVKRNGKVKANLPVRVQKILPNGDLFVEGTKNVIIGGERRELYVSGIVRPADILGDGSVPSSRVADAEIEYNGDGDVSDTEQRGWLSRLFTQFWPF